MPVPLGPWQVEHALKNMCVGEEDKEDQQAFQDCTDEQDKIQSRLHGA
jgi:hypothetical protein